MSKQLTDFSSSILLQALDDKTGFNCKVQSVEKCAKT